MRGEEVPEDFFEVIFWHSRFLHKIIGLENFVLSFSQS